MLRKEGNALLIFQHFSFIFIQRLYLICHQLLCWKKRSLKFCFLVKNFAEVQNTSFFKCSLLSKNTSPWCLESSKTSYNYLSKKSNFSSNLSKSKIGQWSVFLTYSLPLPGSSVVSVSDSWPGGCEFDPRLRRLFFLAYFRLSPLQKYVRKVVGGFGKKSCVSTVVKKSEKTYASPTAMIWP